MWHVTCNVVLPRRILASVWTRWTIFYERVKTYSRFIVTLNPTCSSESSSHQTTRQIRSPRKFSSLPLNSSIALRHKLSNTQEEWMNNPEKIVVVRHKHTGTRTRYVHATTSRRTETSTGVGGCCTPEPNRKRKEHNAKNTDDAREFTDWATDSTGTTAAATLRTGSPPELRATEKLRVAYGSVVKERRQMARGAHGGSSWSRFKKEKRTRTRTERMEIRVNGNRTWKADASDTGRRLRGSRRVKD